MLFAAVSLAARGQFEGLATPYDGSAVYFASTLRLKGQSQPRHGKLFVADERGVRLFRSRDRVDLPPSALPCTLGDFYAFTGAEVSADGRTVAASMERTAAGGCSYPPSRIGADLISPGGERDVPGVVRLSPSGRYAIVFYAPVARPFSTVDVSFLDLQTGTRTPAAVPPPAFPDYLRFFPIGDRVIANDGAAILSYGRTGFLVRPGTQAQAFPVADALPLLISADGAQVLYEKDGLHLLNLETKEDRLVLAAGSEYSNLSMSDDGQRLLFLRGGQAYLVQTDGAGLRALTGDPARIQRAILSGNGKIVYAVTGGARLIKIHADTGEQTEIIGRTPYLNPAFGLFNAGLAVTVTGAGLSDVLAMWIEERKVPVLEVTPASIGFLVPWDVRPAGAGQVRILAETPGEHSPFDFPETFLQIGSFPRAGAIARQNWDGLADFNSPPHAGEIIHIWAVGLGAVSPEPPEGTLAPSAEPLARLAAPLVCSGSEVLYAGLAPGYLERIYQVDLRIGNVTGYTQFRCSLGAHDPFIFVSLNVLP